MNEILESLRLELKSIINLEIELQWEKAASGRLEVGVNGEAAIDLSLSL